jgi:hypothetical protein
MQAHHELVAHLNFALLVLLLLGLIVHRRHRLCSAFVAYTVAVTIGNRLVMTWPDTFFTSWFWSLKEVVYGVLKVAVVAQIGLLTLSEFPRARRLFVWLIAVVSAAALAAQFAPHSVRSGYLTWLSVVSPRGQVAVLTLIAVTLGLVAYYRVPVHPFHRALLLGFVLYLGAYTGSTTLVREWGVAGYDYCAALDPAAYAASVGVWVWGAWRRARELSPEAQRLQPWAASSW